MPQQLIWPSVMAKTASELQTDLKHLTGLAKFIHLDLVDGKFAPNKTLQFPLKLTSGFSYNIHLMMKHPEQWIKSNKAKIDLYIPQFEEIKQPEKYILEMKKARKKVAFALKPETRIAVLKPFLKQIDFILILTVKPGFYGSPYQSQCLKKIGQIKKINKNIKIIIDGGMNPSTISKAKKAGADFFVSGSYTTKAEHPEESIKNLIKEIAL